MVQNDKDGYQNEIYDDDDVLDPFCDQNDDEFVSDRLSEDRTDEYPDEDPTEDLKWQFRWIKATRLIDEVEMASYRYVERELEMEYLEKTFAPSSVKRSFRKNWAYYFLRGHKAGLKRDRFTLWASREKPTRRKLIKLAKRQPDQQPTLQTK